MRLKVVYKRNSDNDGFAHDVLEITDLDNPDGPALKNMLVQKVSFEIAAADMLPRLTLTVIPAEVYIECNGKILAHDVRDKARSSPDMDKPSKLSPELLAQMAKLQLITGARITNQSALMHLGFEEGEAQKQATEHAREALAAAAPISSLTSFSPLNLEPRENATPDS